jgi:uncharacterized protein YqhQ
VSQQQVTYGGQAVLEGVMMRGPRHMAVAVRRPDGQIVVHQQEVNSILQRVALLRLPVLRGMVALVETLSLGMSALMYSASQAMPEEEPLTKKEMALTSGVGILLALGIFVAIPTLATYYTRQWLGTGALSHAVEGAMRLALFIGYMAVISLAKDIQRVYQYHGAEHKVINTFEAGAPLTVEAARAHSREHKRCGTSFLLYVVVLSILLFSIFTIGNVWLRILVRILMMPLVAGISFEIIRLMGRYDNALVNLISRPGMWLQGLTTREPDDSQLEVAIVAFEAARGEKVAEPISVS